MRQRIELILVRDRWGKGTRQETEICHLDFETEIPEGFKGTEHRNDDSWVGNWKVVEIAISEPESKKRRGKKK